jgi:hypothetical protein
MAANTAGSVAAAFLSVTPAVPSNFSWPLSLASSGLGVDGGTVSVGGPSRGVWVGEAFTGGTIELFVTLVPPQPTATEQDVMATNSSLIFIASNLSLLSR